MSSLVTIPRTRRPSARSFRLGIDTVDQRALENRAIDPASLTLILGNAMSGRTTAAVGVVQAALADLVGTDQKVVFIAGDGDTGAIAALDTPAHQRNLRYAAATSLAEAGHVLATVFADAYSQAQAAGESWSQHAPVLVVIDDACMMSVTPDAMSAAQTYRALVDLSADLGTGSFSLDVENVVGGVQARLAAYAHSRTRSRVGLPVATVLTGRTLKGVGVVTAAAGPHDLVARAHLVVNPCYSRLAGTSYPQVLKSRSFPSDG